jgi:hypothetical protein
MVDSKAIDDYLLFQLFVVVLEEVVHLDHLLFVCDSQELILI